jgi:hypothetical protein
MYEIQGIIKQVYKWPFAARRNSGWQPTATLLFVSAVFEKFIVSDAPNCTLMWLHTFCNCT